MRVREVVRAGGSLDLRSNGQERSGRLPEVDRIYDNQRIESVVKLLHQVNAANPDVEDTHVLGHALPAQPVDDGDAETVVAP